MDIQQKNNPDTLESKFLPVFPKSSWISCSIPSRYDIIRALHKGWKWIIFGIQDMVVQREDTTGMGTILLEEVYQGHFVELKSSKTRVMLSGEVSLLEVVGPQVLVLYMDTRECRIQV
jgi:hypothetical protein